ncbi:hypothetical protein HYH02_005409 [Chlamydomonas schloesseri]|uniref:Uncharacterized protein n=1 Tax=Chlamydomonas schloesseri TaxID=2026947 RepID=A0A836B7E2_9CHLO|nr:hypothetical protein HYH02_005409 [Chlamydomonas schloesseri]|eukprot:KAG2449887.1 hypothetical protein HYH02_005409 [Chlamydomonas schloesseri]
MSKLDKFMALPEDDSDSDDSDKSEAEEEAKEEEEEEEAEVKGPAKKKAAISVEDLERAGYKSGPSVLYVKPPSEAGEQNWAWGSGREAKDKGQDSDEDRGATRAAVRGVEESAVIAVKAMAQQAALREGARQERLDARLAAQEKKAAPLSWNQKEKRKRDEGKTSRAKNYVEESKRQAREFGIYSGFD